VQAVEGVVGEHSSVSSSVLASLEGRLAEIDMGWSLGRRIRTMITTVGVTAEISMAGANLAHIVGDASQGRLPTADRNTSISEMRQDQARQQQENYADVDIKWKEEHPGEVPGP